MPDTSLLEAVEPARAAREPSSPCMARLDRLGWAVCDWFEVEGYRFGVRSTSARFGAWVREALAPYLAPGPRDPDDDPLYSFVIAEPPTAGSPARQLHIFYVGTLDVVRSFDLVAVARAFLAEVESLTFPVRDDAVYVEASVIRGRDATALIPTWMVPPINAAGRRIRRAFELELPCSLSVALDPRSGHLVPVRRTLEIPAGALDALVGSWPPAAEPDLRASVDEEARVDRVVVIGGVPAGTGVHPAARGPVLFDLARSIRNLPIVRGDGLRAVGRALSGAEATHVQWANGGQLVDVVGSVLNGGRDVADRTASTAEA